MKAADNRLGLRLNLTPPGCGAGQLTTTTQISAPPFASFEGER